jgi:hypothetical protein
LGKHTVAFVVKPAFLHHLRGFYPVARPAELGVPGEADLETLTVARFRCLQRLLEPSSA